MSRNPGKRDLYECQHFSSFLFQNTVNRRCPLYELFRTGLIVLQMKCTCEITSRHISTGLRGKKSKISQDFQGQIRGKISRFSRDFRGIFAGKKSKFVEKSANFVGFSRKKSQISQKNRPISRDFSGKKSNFEGFSGANS